MKWQRKRRRLRRFSKARHQDETSLRQAADISLDLYVNFAIPEARTRGMPQPVEGILLVRERQEGLAPQDRG